MVYCVSWRTERNRNTSAKVARVYMLRYDMIIAESNGCEHYNDVIMASQITGVSIVCSSVGSGADQRKYQSSASLVFVWEIHRWPVNSPLKGPVTRKRFPFDDVIMRYLYVSHILVKLPLNSLWCSNDVWCHKTWSTLVQAMTCCLRAPAELLPETGNVDQS